MSPYIEIGSPLCNLKSKAYLILTALFLLLPDYASAEGPVVIKTGKTTLSAKTTELNGVTEVKIGAELEITPQ